MVLPDTVRLPDTTRLPSKVSSSSDLKNCAEDIPSNRSASRPEPVPSTVLINVSRSLASALNSTMDSTPPVSCLMYILPSAVFMASSPNSRFEVVGILPATALRYNLINVDIYMSFLSCTYEGKFKRFLHLIL